MTHALDDESFDHSDRAPVAESRDTRHGELIGRSYRLQNRIGSGGMGEVYSAEHIRLGRQFAVKLLRPNREAKAAERFRREAKAIARVQSEYVVTVVDCGELNDGTPYLVMELLQGADLRCLLEQCAPLPIPRAVSLICDACEGVAAVHRAGLVHRDLKPGNLFITKRSSGEDWCKVLDFGVAKLDSSVSTAEGALIGTVKYMAPEQLRDGASAGPAVDIYALSAILYESLCGVPPHSGVSTQELMFKIMNEEPVRLDERQREIPPALAAAVQRALAKRPSERFATVRDFASSISPFARVDEYRESRAHAETAAFERDIDRSHAGLKRRSRTVALSLLVVLAAWLVGRAQASREQRGSAALSPAPAVSIAAPTPQTPAVARDVIPSAAAGTAPVARSESAIVPSNVTEPPRAPRRTVATGAHATSPFPNARFDADNPYAH